MTLPARSVFRTVRSPRTGDAMRPIGQVGRLLADADARIGSKLSARREAVTPGSADRQLPLALHAAAERRPGGLVRALRPVDLAPAPVPGLERSGGWT